MNVLLTERCNRRCTYCFLNNKASSARHMSLADFDRCLDFAEVSGDFALNLLGGEPTLHPQFVEAAERAWHRGFQVVLFSNFMFTHKTALRIRNASERGVIKGYLVNADLPRHYSAAQIKRFMANLSVVARRPIEITLSITLAASNSIEDYDYLLEYYRAYDITRVRLSLDVRTLWGMVGSRDLGQTYYRLVRRLAERGYAVCAELCAVPRCLFSEDEAAYLGVHCANFATGTGCEPNLDVFPDMTVRYCAARPPTGSFHRPLYWFASLSHARAYYRALRDMLHQASPPDACAGCGPALHSQCRLGCLSRFDGVPESPTAGNVPGKAPPDVIVRPLSQMWHVWAAAPAMHQVESLVLDSSAMDVLGAAWSGRSVDEIVAELTQRFDVSKERAYSDVVSVTKQARYAGVLE